MSFGSGGFGGFGSNNNTNTFGGFGASNNNASGFGASNNNTSNPFGASSNAGGSLFGGGNNQSSGFGGFGANNNNNTTSFGSKPFGSTSTGGLFGGGTSTAGSGFGSGGGGGFGSTANNTTSAFGSNNAGGGLFGANKTGFGSTSTNTGGSGLFGGGNTTGSAFGSNTNTTSAFGGGSTSGGFGATQVQNQANNGTASVPFNSFQEKDTAGTQHFQTITFQDPYKNYSLEELRLADYNQGRRYGNQNGQGGAFGQSTGFGGFGSNNNNTSTGFGSNTAGNTGGGLFGNNNNNATTGAFGQNNNAGGFGSTNTNNAGGGLFGSQNKTGGLFGSTSTSQPTTGGGLFGSASNNTGGFGTGSTGGFGATTNNAGGGLFGNQNQNQNKTGFGFGSNTNTSTNTGGGLFGNSTGTSAFGQSNNTTGGGLFGQQNQTTSTPAFGSTAQPTSTGGGLFGNTGGGFGQTQQNQNTNAGGLFGASGSGFGQNNQNQNKPAASLFNNSTNTNTTGGGLFGSTNQNQQSGGSNLFGNQQNQNQGGGGLFAPKPAAPGGLFGNSTTANTGGGGLFNNLGGQNQQNQGGSLFGNQQNQQKSSLFGNAGSSNTAGGGLFGGGLGQSTSNNNLGGSLFSNQNSQPQAQQSQFGNSGGFGASGNSLLQTSMTTNPYGNDALFAGLATPTASPGPLATPLSSNQKARKSAILPQHKLNPSASGRLLTPQKRMNGFGFTYSTYGTPSSASSAGSPSFSSSLMNGGSFTRSLGRSLSSSNLRNSYTPETSVLAPGAFSATGRSFAGGSLKKLNVNRSINARVSLFGEDAPSAIKKRVSFDRSATGGLSGTSDDASTSSALVVVPDDTPAEGGPSTSSLAGPGRPEMQEVNGTHSKDLTPVSENPPPLSQASASSLNTPKHKADPTPGEYWSEPTLDVLRNMGPDELSHVANFTVGRKNVGKILFNKGNPVDLREVNLDKLFGDIVHFSTRMATVYGEPSTEKKPKLGRALNVPSRLILGNCWSRGKNNHNKHIKQLKRVADTHFEDYNGDTGEWTFTVDHFSSYGLDYAKYSEDSDEEDSSELSDAPPTTPAVDHSAVMSDEDDDISVAQSSPDDTFDFKKGKRKRGNLPGGFSEEDLEDQEYVGDVTMETQQSFLGERSVGSLDGQHDADYSESGSDLVDEQDMADSVSGPVQTTEQYVAKNTDPFKDSIMPKSILKVSQPSKNFFGTPSKGPLVFDDDWAGQLQRTISPKKQDRAALRESQGHILTERDNNVGNVPQPHRGETLPTSIDLMKDLFMDTDKPTKLPPSKRENPANENPYSKRAKTEHDLDPLSPVDQTFHDTCKPRWNIDGTLVYTRQGINTLADQTFEVQHPPRIYEHQSTSFVKLPTFNDAVTPTLEMQKTLTRSRTDDSGVPVAKIVALDRDADVFQFSEFAEVIPVEDAHSIHEHKVWQLLSVLFDDPNEMPADVSREAPTQYIQRYRKTKFSEFWRELVQDAAEEHAHRVSTPQEKAIAYLSGHNVAEASRVLLEGLDLRLATMTAQIGGDVALREQMQAQIEQWREMDVLSEMDDGIRALYELIAGNCGTAEGKIASSENAAATFKIASRFGLDWRRAFGLRLWYGTLEEEDLKLAVAQYADALRDGKEDVRPLPWFTEQEISTGWNDPQADHREDLLWGILKLYASSTTMGLKVNVEEVLAPENVSGNPLNARLSFQLFQLFKQRQDDEDEEFERKVTMPAIRDSDFTTKSLMSSTTSSAGSDGQSKDALTDLGDKLTLTYAASLHTPEHWKTAIYAYLHLSSPAMREHYIRALLTLSRHWASSDADDKYLVDELNIPAAWLHASIAIKAKADGDAVTQASHLIKAHEMEEAHEVLCRSVGPDAVISRDYDALRELLGDFIPSRPNSPADDVSSVTSSVRGRRAQQKNEPVQGWSHGGQIYFDYIHLLDLTSHQSSYRIDEALNSEINDLLTKLQGALEVVAREKWSGRTLEERVALAEIGSVIAKQIASSDRKNKAAILRLPLTEDRWLKHTRELANGYFRNVLAAR